MAFDGLFKRGGYGGRDVGRIEVQNLARKYYRIALLIEHYEYNTPAVFIGANSDADGGTPNFVTGILFDLDMLNAEIMGYDRRKSPHVHAVGAPDVWNRAGIWGAELFGAFRCISWPWADFNL